MSTSTALSKAVVVQTQEEERYRLARALQSGPAQVFANAALEIETSLRLMDEQPESARAGLTALVAELKVGLREIRDLIAELQPPLLGECGLGPSLRKYSEAFTRRSGIELTLTGVDSFSERFPSTMEVAIFRIIQEALENVRSHAQATRAQIIVERAPGKITVVVEDNGRGFVTPNDAPTPGRRLGLVAMTDRAELLNGQLQVFSEPAHGVRVVLTVPFRGA